MGFVYEVLHNIYNIITYIYILYIYIYIYILIMTLYLSPVYSTLYYFLCLHMLHIYGIMLADFVHEICTTVL